LSSIVEMDLSFDCNRLAKDVLTYELKIRGFEELGTVEEMRSCLRNVLKLERLGQTLTYLQYNLQYDQEIQTSKTKVDELLTLIEDFTDTVGSGPYKKITSKIAHVVKRIDRIPTGNNQQIKERSALLSKALTLLPKLKTKIRSLRSTDISVLDASLLNLDEESEDSDEVTTPITTRHMSLKPSTESPLNIPNNAGFSKSIPVFKWNLKFSGEDKNSSIASFLERVEKLRKARHGDKRELFDSAYDLFTNTAEKWYSANVPRFSDWDELALALKKQFQPPDYDDRLFEELKRRTQGDDENIGIYVANMKGFFQRLSCQVPEATQLKIIQKNLNPYYQLHLGLVEVTSIDHLVELCCKLEVKKHCIERFSKPVKKRGDLEPDLAYVDAIPSCSSVNTSMSSSLKCWNCGKSGHKDKECRQKPRLHCFRCGKPEVTVRNCPGCAQIPKSSGNH